jgi:hypothetical protein
MAKSEKFDLENPAPVVDDEDEETLAAIDEGMRDAEAGCAPAKPVGSYRSGLPPGVFANRWLDCVIRSSAVGFAAMFDG